MIHGLSTTYLIAPQAGQPSSGRKLSVPVRPLLASTMLFKHVKGVPARPPAQSIPIFKVQALDMMLNRLTRMGGNAKHLSQKASIDDRITAARQALKRTEASRQPFTSGLTLDPGILVNHLA